VQPISHLTGVGRPAAAIALALFLVLLSAFGEEPAKGKANPLQGFHFINTGFENASPLWYETDAEGIIHIHLNYDPERSSPNRAAGHFHFQVQAKPGSHLTVEFNNLDNVWLGSKR
jgi:hypothetical protein